MRIRGQLFTILKMTHGKDKKNFKVYTAEAFIAAITQQIAREIISNDTTMLGIANKSRGLRLKQGIYRPGDEPITDSD